MARHLHLLLHAAGTGSLAAAGTAGTGKQYVLEPRQAGAAMTTGVVKPVPVATNRQGSAEVRKH